MDLEDLDYYLDVNGSSKHLGTDYPYNEKNDGFGLTAENNDSNLIKMLTAGGYKNSFSEPSYYAGGGLAKRFGVGDYDVDVGGIAGGVTGYNKSLSPLVAALLAIEKEKLGKLRFMYAPETDNNPSLIMMNLGIPIK